MKRVFALISMASAATAAGIRGDAVEEVGEPIEHYPPPHHGGYDRRSLLDEIEMDAEILGSYAGTALDAKESFPDEGSVEVSFPDSSGRLRSSPRPRSDCLKASNDTV